MRRVTALLVPLLSLTAATPSQASLTVELGWLAPRIPATTHPCEMLPGWELPLSEAPPFDAPQLAELMVGLAHSPCERHALYRAAHAQGWSPQAVVEAWRKHRDPDWWAVEELRQFEALADGDLAWLRDRLLAPEVADLLRLDAVTESRLTHLPSAVVALVGEAPGRHLHFLLARALDETETPHHRARALTVLAHSAGPWSLPGVEELFALVIRDDLDYRVRREAVRALCSCEDQRASVLELLTGPPVPLPLYAIQEHCRLRDPQVPQRVQDEVLECLVETASDSHHDLEGRAWLFWWIAEEDPRLGWQYMTDALFGWRPELVPVVLVERARDPDWVIETFPDGHSWRLDLLEDLIHAGTDHEDVELAAAHQCALARLLARRREIDNTARPVHEVALSEKPWSGCE
ncbi:MAG: hypothetical protein AAF533_15980 [Acidobacteriota bacterium]